MKTNPYLGVLAVLLGGSLSTLNGRLLTEALPDLRGALHLSVDEAAWLPAAYNMSLMFMGVFSVYLGAILGPRRVLLISCAGYAFSSFLMPWASSYNALLGLHIAAGLTSGAFYPLTLTFILTSLPIRLAPWGLASYSIAILFSANFASSLSSWYLNVVSWRGVFWHAAWIAPLMAVCVFFGMPRQPLPPQQQVGPSWRGLLYWSFGLSLLYGALDQGERLHWFNSGAFAAMLITGAYFVVTSILRRYKDPNPLINLPFIRRGTTVLLAFILFSFRLFLLATAFLIPQFLGNVQGLRNEQIGPLLSLVALLQLAAAWLVASSLRQLNSRLLMAVGFVTIGVATALCTRITIAWQPSTFLPYAILFALGESFAMLGLVTSIIFQVISLGAVTMAGKPVRPFDVLTFSGFFHSVRIMGGELGTVLMGHLLTQRIKFHTSILSQQLQTSKSTGLDFMGRISSFLLPSVSNSVVSSAQSYSVLATNTRRQAATLAFSDAFWVMTYASIAALLLITLLRIRIKSFAELTR